MYSQLLRLSKKLYVTIYCQSSSERYISYLRNQGIKIGSNCIFRGPRNSLVDITRPSLVEIGDFVDMNQSFTILTHDYGTSVFLRKYKDFINSSGKVIIGNNIYFGTNCTVLKGVTIGDNCIIAAYSLVVKDIPPNSIAAGIPAKVIGSLDDYYSKRKKTSIAEAFEFARSIKERFNRRPTEEDFKEEFPLFINGRDAKKHTMAKWIEFQLMEAYPEWEVNHIATFENFEEFLTAAGVV